MRYVLAAYFALASVAFAATPAAPALANLAEAARVDYQNGALDSALAKIEQHDKVRGRSGESLNLRGAILLEQGKMAEAAKVFEAAHKLQPELFAPRLHLGDVLLREKKFTDARQIYQQLVAETNILTSNERVRYGLYLALLGLHDEGAAKRALANIKFPTETPAYYFAQAASEFAQGHEGPAKKWIATARQIFQPDLFAWFAGPLFDFGWLKDKPPPPTI